MKQYLPRIIDDVLKRYLNIWGAILIIGPKWCGKTTTAKQFSQSILKLQDPDSLKSNLQLAEIKPSKLLEGKKPRLIDEWQVAPVLWDAVRTSVDELEGKGHYILTGSTVVDETKIMHSGVGRIHRLLMMPMTLYESGDSNGKISLKELFENKEINIDAIKSDLTIEELIFVTCRGGWPETINIENKKDQLEIAKSYINEICESDVSHISGTKRDPERVKNILKAYARNISTLAKDTTIMKDIVSNYEDITKPTYYSYVDSLKRLFVINNIKGWSPNIRSATMIRKGTKKEFIDPSIAVAALDLSPEKLLFDLNTYGFIFENLCIRDLTVYSKKLDGNIYYYHDKTDLEVDCVLVLDNGNYGLIEFKIGSKEIEKGSKNLIKLDKLIKEKIKEGKTKIPEPSFLAIITGGEYAYTRKDGVKIIPIGCLKD